MKKILSIILILYSFSTFGQGEIIRYDQNAKKSVNPYQNQLDNLYKNNYDSIEYFYVPELILPDLYFIDSLNDTVYIKIEENKTYTNFITFGQFIMLKDSTLLSEFDQISFQLSVNWKGEIYYIEAYKIIGNFNKEKWTALWNEIKALPGKNSKVPDRFNFNFTIIVKEDNNCH